MRARAVGLVLGGLVLVGSCSRPDGSTSPLRSSLDLSAGTVSLVAPVTRTTPLDSDVTWTFTAGPFGAVSSNAAVGLTVTIPAGALTSVQQITVTALAGNTVAYGFSPHLTFGVPVVLTQSLAGTSAAGTLSVLSGAHFTSDSLQLDNGLALIDELVPATTNSLTQTTSFSVGHFSGWIIATDDGTDGSGGSN